MYVSNNSARFGIDLTVDQYYSTGRKPPHESGTKSGMLGFGYRVKVLTLLEERIMSIVQGRNLLGAATALGLLLCAVPAFAGMDEAKKWIDSEFQPSTLSKDEQMKEMEWQSTPTTPLETRLGAAPSWQQHPIDPWLGGRRSHGDYSLIEGSYKSLRQIASHSQGQKFLDQRRFVLLRLYRNNQQESLQMIEKASMKR